MGKLIFILIDGLRCDIAFRHMGFLESLAEAGLAARYRIKSELPSMSRPLYETLMSGIRPAESGIVSNEIRRLSTQENLFGLTRKNGMRTAAAAFGWFSELYNRAPFIPLTDRIQNDEECAIQHGIFYFEGGFTAYPDSHLIADAET